MDNWKIDNHSNRKFLIQKNEGELSIVEPLDNGAFKILAEINLSNENDVNIYDSHLYVSVSLEQEEICIFDNNNT
ncbi:hypothetical protein ACYJ80_07670 [Staphylococcus capitis]|uniref:Uncharacterized protein n=1 Tax=Staphylococcus capitis TaxID=29388 RepID=A0A7X9ZI29_STACP|nr:MULTISPECIES: hypothetical protein [Staphylococcus]MBW4835710.1 hypothetical protein [Staphylococcaceae bacterium]AKL91308.1 hypothetical protein AYP1020_0158 [Staphylococcus capitis subsp. capitis]ATN03317.1 hypothetical protein CRN29_08915 [Staphylococcus capitis]EEE49852.1 hypothetical protein STACA0001_0239 [Staphylococcus capitis SK14]EGS41124.1 hypothetical protein SEVCU116_1613 [Staphylococcus capitis VCU116]